MKNKIYLIPQTPFNKGGIIPKGILIIIILFSVMFSQLSGQTLKNYRDSLVVRKKLSVPSLSQNGRPVPIYDTSYLNFASIVIWGDSFTAEIDSTIKKNGAKFNIKNMGIAGHTTYQIKERFLADTLYKKSINIIWAGYNNLSILGADSNTIKSSIDSMVAVLNSYSNPNYVIVSILTGRDDSIGTARYTHTIAVNNYLKRTYPNKYLALRDTLLKKLVSGNALDISDTTAGIVPRSLRRDATHLSYMAQSGGTGLIAGADSTNYKAGLYGYTYASQQILRFIESHYIPPSNRALTYYDLFDIFRLPPAIGMVKLTDSSFISYNGQPILRYFDNGSVFIARGGYNNSIFSPVPWLGRNNFVAMQEAGYNLKMANDNILLGPGAGYMDTSGSYNIILGTQGFYTAKNARHFVGIGFQTFYSGALNGFQEYSTAIGPYSLSACNASNMLGLGAFSGRYASIAGGLFINSFNRSTLAGDTTNSIIYGVQTSTGVGQRVKFNAAAYIRDCATYADDAAAKSAGLTTGDIYKKSDGTLMIVLP
jgi:hypothetical protein